MNIQNFIPSPRLRPYIKHYYLAEGSFAKKTHDVFFADGCMEIVFNLDLAFYRNNEKEPWAKLIGQITDPLHVQAKGTGKSFGIWFSPYGLSKFTNLPLGEFTNKAVPLDTIFHKNFIDLVGHALVKDRPLDLINGVNTFFENLLTNDAYTLKETVASHAVGKLTLQDHDDLSLTDLAKECNVSLRYLQKIFAEKVGLSPKQFQQTMRFQRALGHMNASPGSTLTTTTYQSGYFDQSHFIREFKTFTGFLPSQYEVANHPINQYYLIP